MAEQITLQDFIDAWSRAAADRGHQIIHAVGAFGKRGPYERLHFDSYARAELVRLYRVHRDPTFRGTEEDRELDADHFIAALELCADGMRDLDEIEPPPQDERRERLRRLGAALARVQSALADVDSNALSYAIHHVEKAVASEGWTPIAGDPVSAFVVAGHVRDFSNANLLKKASDAVHTAAESLPLMDRQAYDGRLRSTLYLEEVFFERGLPFEAKETGLAAECLRAAFELANPGKTLDRPKHTLQKAMAHPDSLTSLRAANKNGPEN